MIGKHCSGRSYSDRSSRLSRGAYFLSPLVAALVLSLPLKSMAQESSTTQIRISWPAASQAVEGYRIYLLEPGAQTTREFTAASNELVVDLGSTPKAGIYRACISAVGANGQEGPCSTVTVAELR